MTDASGPQNDEPRDPQPTPPMWVEPTQPGATYPPGFEPGASEASPADGIWGSPGSGYSDPAADGATEPKRAASRRPVVAGVVGGVLIALLGFGGGYAVSHVGGDDGGQFSTQGVSRLLPPGEGHGDGDGDGVGDGDGDGGPGQRLAPGGSLPGAGTQESGADT